MATFDVRDNASDEITEIRFANKSDYYLPIAETIVYEGDGDILLSGHSPEQDARICRKTHARNLIKALEKAIELGWLKD